VKKPAEHKPASNGVSGPHTPRVEPPPATAPERDPRALARLDWIALGLLAAVLLIAPLWAGFFATPSFSPQATPGLLELLGAPLSVALTAAAFGVVAWREWKRPVAIGAVRGLAGALALLAAWAALSLVRSQALALSLNALAALLAALLLGGLVARLVRDRNGFTALLLTVIAAGSLIAGMGVREYLEYWKSGVAEHRVFATFANPDFLAGYLLLTLPLTLSAFAATTNRMARLALGVGLWLQSGCLLLTGSRAGVALLLVALAVWAALLAVSRAGAGRWKRIGAGLAIVAVGALLASAPLLSRVANRHIAPAQGTSPARSNPLASVQATAEAQSHSASFRRYTWTGTFRMAKAHPILGTGLGTYDVAYPRYAETAYTAHAHNSYLQLAAEVGFPGVLLLLTALAAATAFAAHVLLLQTPPEALTPAPSPTLWERGEAQQESSPSSTFQQELKGKNTPAPTPPLSRSVGEGSGVRANIAGQLAFEEPRLLLAGLLTAALASMLHSVIDSDWYIVATAFTLCAVVALMVAAGRDLAPLATQIPRPLAPAMTGVGALLALFLLWRAGATGFARLEMAGGTEALMNRQSAVAAQDFEAAAGADPLDPEPRLALAQVYVFLQRPEDARRQLEEAARVAATGKTFYRLGQFYARQGDPQRAVAAFQRSRELQPNNPQNLRALAEALLQAGQTEQAAEVYRTMARMEEGPYGKVRAVPEMVETEFAYAHDGLAELAYNAGNWEEAAAQYARAAAILREFWERRTWDTAMLVAPEKRTILLDLYDKVLTRWQEALNRQGAAKAAEAAKVAEAQKQFRAERAEEDAKAQSPGASAIP